MSKSILFIAVQCHQCSTMQVKQQKKSSNKWNCAVCNEKQSVRKVYAQGYQAKDIRQVVQSFNMSRKFADDEECRESSLGHFVEHLEGGNVMAEDVEKAVKRRSDWSEYVEDVDVDSLEPDYLKSRLQEGKMYEEKVVTELPEEVMFKKPKLKGNSGSSSLTVGENRGYRPQFTRNTAARKDVMKTRPGSSDVSTAKNEVQSNVYDGDYSTDISSRFQQGVQKSKDVGMKKTGASKWDEYLTDDTGYRFEGKNTPFIDGTRAADGCKVQTDVEDVLVEEDIHPDFM